MPGAITAQQSWISVKAATLRCIPKIPAFEGIFFNHNGVIFYLAVIGHTIKHKGHGIIAETKTKIRLTRDSRGRDNKCKIIASGSQGLNIENMLVWIEPGIVQVEIHPCI